MADGDARFTFIFDVLPLHQVKEFVFSRLDLESIKNCRLVCKRWEERVSETVDFNPRLTDEETAQVIKKMTKPIKDLTLRFLNFSYPKDGIGFTSVQNLILDFLYKWESGKTCKENFHRLLKECEDVQSLHVLYEAVQRDSADDSDVSFLFLLRKIVLNNLRRLKMVSKIPDFRAQLFRKTFPHLTSLFIYFLYSPIKRRDSPYMDLYHTQIFESIGRHGRTLKHIAILRGDDIHKFRRKTWTDIEKIEERGLHQVKLCDLDPDAKQTLIDQLKQVQLSTFEYHATQADEVYPFCYEMFKAQTQLTKLAITAGQTQFWNLVVPQVLEQCAHTLKEIKLAGYSSNIGMPIDKLFSFSLLARCSELEIFHVGLDYRVRLTDMQFLPKQLKNLSFYLRGRGRKKVFRFTASQVEFIAREMNNLEYLNLSGLKLIEPEGMLKVFDLLLFKKLIKMPRLTKLNIPIESSVRDEIHTWIAESGQGCITYEYYESPEYDYYYESDLNITVDRLNFDSDLIVL